MTSMFEQPSGAFVVTEQGDLGLGLTPIDEGFTQDDDKCKDEKEKNLKNNNSNEASK